MYGIRSLGMDQTSQNAGVVPEKRSCPALEQQNHVI